MIHKHYGHVQPLETAKRISNMTTRLEKMRNRLIVDDLRRAGEMDKEDDQPWVSDEEMESAISGLEDYPYLEEGC